MYRIDDPSASNTLPTPEAALTEGYWTEGNPGSGIPATLERASWFNMIQEELRAIVVAGGLTPSKTTYNQLLQALRSAGVFQTATQFDSTTKAATTAFVQRALGNFSGVNIYTTNGTLLPTDMGQLIRASGSGGYAINLPLTLSVPSGASVTIFATSPNITLARSGTDVILVSGTPVTSLILNPGDSSTLVRDQTGSWSAWGSSQFGYSSAFDASRAVNGYQKLPGGTLLQWGSFASNGVSGGDVNVTFPVAFSNLFALNVSASGTGTSGISAWWKVQSTTGFTGASSAVNTTTPWFAIGKI